MEEQKPTQPLAEEQPNTTQDEHSKVKNKKSKLIASLFALIILLVGAASALGYLLLNDESDDPDQINTNQQTETPQPETYDTDKTEVSGLTVYENKEYDFSFEYPAEWGIATLVDGPETDHLVEGYEKQIKFSNNPNILGGFQSLDREHDPLLGHGGGLFYTVESINEQAPSDSNGVYVNENSSYLFVQPPSTFVGYNQQILRAGIDTTNSSIGPVNFLYLGDPLEDFNDPVTYDEEQAQAEIETTFPESDFRVELVKVLLNSFKNL